MNKQEIDLVRIGDEWYIDSNIEGLNILDMKIYTPTSQLIDHVVGKDTRFLRIFISDKKKPRRLHLSKVQQDCEGCMYNIKINETTFDVWISDYILSIYGFYPKDIYIIDIYKAELNYETLCFKI